MAKQAGINPYLGTIGNLTFMKTSDGFRVRMKGGVSRERILKDPQYARTRENMADFATAGNGVRLLRITFNSEVRNASDKRMNPRLLQALRKALNTDTTHRSGQRRLEDAQLSGLKGFDFNADSTVSYVLPVQYQLGVNREEGKVTLSVNPFVPEQEVRFPIGAAYFSLTLAVGELDFAHQTGLSTRVDSSPKALNDELLTLPPLECTFTPESDLPIFVVMGVLFYKDEVGGPSPLKDRVYNCMSIVEVDE